MKNFRDYINEEMMPFAQTEKGFVGVDNGPVRDNINLLLATITERPHATPYHALEVVRKVLAPFHIHPPATNFLDGNEGHEIFQINQFGEKMGMTNSGDVVTKDSSPYFLYFEYSMNSRGSFDIFSEIVNQEELDEILDDVEDDIEDDTTTGNGEDAEDSFDVYRAGNKLEEDLDEGVIRGTAELVKHGVVVPVKAAGRAIGGTVKAVGAVAGGVRKTVDDMQDAAKKIRAAYAQQSSKKIKKKKKEVEQLDEVGDTKKGKIAINRVALRGDAEIADQAIKKRPNKKVLAKAERAVDLSIATHKRRGGNVLGGYLKHAYGIKEEQLDELSKKKLGDYVKKASHDVAARSAAVRGFARDADDQRKDKKAMDARRSDARADKMFKKSWNRRQYMAKAVDKLTTEAQSADTHTGALTYKGKPVVSPTATSVQPTFPPKNVPVPKPRPKNLEESNPAKEGMIAAGYKGSNPAEQGSIAVKKDDENRSNFKVAKKLARKATKEIIKKKKS